MKGTFALFAVVLSYSSTIAMVVPTTTATTSTGPPTTTILEKVYPCASDTPDAATPKNCTKGCFGLYTDGKVKIGCLGDLNVTSEGFGIVDDCTDHLKEGECREHNKGGKMVKKCLGCCKTSECNKSYKDRCDIRPADSTCGSVRNSFTLSMLALIFIAYFVA